MKAKKFLSIVLSLVMAVSAMAMFAVSASADSIADTAKSLDSGKLITIPLSYPKQDADYKIKVSKAGTLKINVSSQFSFTDVYVYDSVGKYVRADSQTEKIGTIARMNSGDFLEFRWQSSMEKAEGSAKYTVSKGTYYIRIHNGTTSEKKVKFKATFPSDDSSADVKLTQFTLEMKKGDTVQLGTLLSGNSDDNVVWKSSKTSVAKVSATGKITAQAKGSAAITATLGDSSLKIQVNVK